VPLARGWERQLDTAVDKLFYSRPLTSKRYHFWLRALGVKWVALPDSQLDYSSQQEALLIRRGLPYLKPVWHSAHWNVYRVTDAQPLAKGAATLVAQTATSETLYARRKGRATLHVRYTPYWQISEGLGCVSRSPAGWTLLQIASPARSSSPRRGRPTASVRPNRGAASSQISESGLCRMGRSPCSARSASSNVECC